VIPKEKRIVPFNKRM